MQKQTSKVAVTTLRAQSDRGFYRPLTLAPADAEAAGGGGADDEKAKAAELTKKLSNPVAALISVPIQNNFDWGAGPSGDGVGPALPYCVPVSEMEDSLIPQIFSLGEKHWDINNFVVNTVDLCWPRNRQLRYRLLFRGRDGTGIRCQRAFIVAANHLSTKPDLIRHDNRGYIIFG